MQISNESTSQVTWAAYNMSGSNQPVASGSIQPMSEIDQDMGVSQVQLKVNGTLYKGPFDDSGKVVINGHVQPIAIAGEIEYWLTLFYGPQVKGPSAPATSTITYISAGAGSKLVFDMVVGLLNTLGPETIPIRVGLSFLGGVVSTLLTNGAAPAQTPPSINDIKTAVAAIIREEDAQKVTAEVIVMRRWLDDILLVGQQLEASGSDFTKDEIDDFDNMLDELLGPNSDLLAILERCRANEPVRRTAIQAYAMGIGLYAQLRNISLLQTQTQRPLVAAEFDTYKASVQAHLDVLAHYASQFELVIDTQVSAFNLVGTATGRALAANIYRRYVGEEGVEPSQFVHEQVNSLQNVITAIDAAKTRAIPVPA
jgi:hypothetical protein